METMKPYAYLLGASLLPIVAFAHNGVEDGDEVAAADPSSRKYVIIGVVVVFALLIAFFIYAKRKNAPPAPPRAPTPAV